MHEDDLNAINYLRQQGAQYLTEHYDSDYNMLRWAQAYDYNLEEARFHLLRHLKFRLFYDLDNIEKIKDNEVLKKYFPLGLVGRTGLDNTLLVVEYAGRIDLQGIMRSVPLTDFLVGRYKFQEKMLNCINHLEKTNGRQSSVLYLLDLEGLKFDSTLLSTVTGPYRILWAAVYTNYPEWISHMFIINAPSFMSILWKAIGPMIPRRTREKVHIFSSRSDWKQALDTMADPDFVPQHWGGTLVDASGDAMCRDRLVIPTDSIPKDLYWQPSEETPRVADLDTVAIPHGCCIVLTYACRREAPTFLVLNKFVDRTYGMAIFYSSDLNAIDRPVDEMDDWMPQFDYPMMPSVDTLRAKVPGPGIFKIRFGNEQAWFRSMTIHYRVRFLDEKNENVDFQRISE